MGVVRRSCPHRQKSDISPAACEKIRLMRKRSYGHIFVANKSAAADFTVNTHSGDILLILFAWKQN
jgi:hypothetical protein